MVRFATLSSCKALAVPFNPWKRSTSGISSWLCIWMLQSQNNNVSWSTGHILRCPWVFLSYRHWVAISKWQNRNKTIYPHALVSLQSKPDRYLAMSAVSLRLLNPWINRGNVHLEEAWVYLFLFQWALLTLGKSPFSPLRRVPCLSPAGLVLCKVTYEQKNPTFFSDPRPGARDWPAGS